MDVRTRSPRSSEELENGLDQVGYELRMMAHATSILRCAQQQEVGDSRMLQNALLESALLHVRSLIEFFIHDCKRPSDICRTDFAPDWEPAPQDVAKRLRERQQMLHRYLAHLTWERVDRSAPAWEYPTVADDVLQVARAWSEHLRASSRELWETFQPHVFGATATLAEVP